MIASFIRDREWEVYHGPKNIASSIAIEAAEILEIFQWLSEQEADGLKNNAEAKRRVGEEIADVVFYCMDLCNCLGLDLSEAAKEKMKSNERKYPVERTRGRYEPCLKQCEQTLRS